MAKDEKCTSFHENGWRSDFVKEEGRFSERNYSNDNQENSAENNQNRNERDHYDNQEKNYQEKDFNSKEERMFHLWKHQVLPRDDTLFGWALSVCELHRAMVWFHWVY